MSNFSDCTTVKRRKTAICSHYRTVVTLGFGSTALLRYGQHPYGAVFCTAVAVDGTVESPTLQAVETATILFVATSRDADILIYQFLPSATAFEGNQSSLVCTVQPFSIWHW